MRGTIDQKLNTAVREPLLAHSLARTDLFDEVRDPMFNDACADSLFDIVAAAALKNDIVNALAVEQSAEQEPRGPRTDDDHLRADCPHSTLLHDCVGHNSPAEPFV
jgi:hypothetical protein